MNSCLGCLDGYSALLRNVHFLEHLQTISRIKFAKIVWYFLEHLQTIHYDAIRARNDTNSAA